MSRQRLIGIVAVCTLILGVATVQAPMALAAGAWWVDNTSPLCSNTGPGTSDTPLCTISAAATRATNAGDQVMVRPGTYAEQVTVAASGGVGSPITFVASAPGVVVLGTRDLSDAAGWTASGATAWSQAYAPPSPPRQVFRDDVRLSAAASLAALTAGQFFYDTVPKVLYVDAGGPNPADGRTIAAGAQTYGFNLVGRSNVVVDGFTLKRQNNAGVRLSGSSADTVQNVIATEAGINGILLESATSNVTVTGSTVSGSASVGIKLSATTGSRIAGNISHGNLFHGISLQGSADNVVAGNTAYNNARPGQRVATGIDVSQSSTGVTVERNTTYGNQDSGIQIYTGSNNAIVRRNVSRDNGDHGLDCLNSPGESVVGNTVVGNVTVGINLEGAPDVGCSGSVVANNISTDNAVSSTTTVGDIRLDVASSPGSTVDRNVVFMTNGGALYQWNSVAYTTVSAFRAASGQEPNGIEADPRYRNLAAGDLRLQGGSPAVDNADLTMRGADAKDHDGRDPVDHPRIANTGAGTPAFTDRGALEYYGAAAVLAVTPGNGTIPLSVTADASSSVGLDGAIATYAFDCGNGTGTGPQAFATTTCSYSSTGVFTVTVTVLDVNGVSDQATATVTSVGQAPVASLTATPSSGTAPLTVALDASGSLDPKGGLLTYLLDCGNGTAVVATPTRTCSYPDVGTFTATATVQDPQGLTGSATRTITAKANLAPVAALTVTPSTDYVPATVTLDATGSTDPEGLPLTYSLTCGNGGPAVLTPIATCVYPTSGTFTANATVTDDHGATSSVSKSVTVKADVAPTVKLAPIKGQVKVNEKVLVDASGSTDPDKTPIASYRIDCGNGVVFGPGPASSATCQYTRSGTYTIRVTVTDTIGKTGSASKVVKVK